MNAFYVLLFILLLYIFFGTIVNVILSTKTSTQFLRIKTKIFFYTFIAPAMFAFAVFFNVLTDNKATNIFLGISIVIGTTISVFYKKRNYLADLSIDNTQLRIKYFTSFLNAREYSFNLTEVTNIEWEKANWLINSPAAINIQSKNNWTKFYLSDRTLKSMIQKDIGTANITVA